jgi:hypothetical protein
VRTHNQISLSEAAPRPRALPDASPLDQTIAVRKPSALAAAGCVVDGLWHAVAKTVPCGRLSGNHSGT